MADEKLAKIECWNRFTKESNEAFKQMTDAQRRVTVAQDVLAQVKGGTLVPATGSYVHIPVTDDLAIDVRSKDLSEVLPDLETCDVCAVGSVAICAIMRLDEFRYNHAWDTAGNDDGTIVFTNGQAYAQAQRVFSNGQLNDMEDVFENWGDYEEEINCNSSLHREQSDEGVLWLIMTCVIENDGEFSADLFWGWVAKKWPPHNRVTITIERERNAE